MQLYDWNQVKEEQLNPRILRKVLHAKNLTVARFQLQKGAVVAGHSHVNEQVSMIERGSLKFIIDGREQIVRAGQTAVIPPNTPHAVEVLEDSVAIEVFSPPREDWIRGDDSYLRG